MPKCVICEAPQPRGEVWCQNGKGAGRCLRCEFQRGAWTGLALLGVCMGTVAYFLLRWML